MIYNQLSLIKCFLIVFLVSLTFTSLALFILEDSTDDSILVIRDISNHDYSKLETTRAMHEVGESVNELWFYLKNELQNLVNKKNSTLLNVTQLMGRIAEQKDGIFVKIAAVSQVNNNLETKQLAQLSEIVQSNLHRLQNPRSCDSAKKIICKVNIYCGFGCFAHHLMYCLMTAYAMNRTLVLDCRGKGIANIWNLWFEPISSCFFNSSQSVVEWNDLQHPLDCQSPNLVLPLFMNMENVPDFAPLAIPRQIGYTLSRLHGYPFVWWAGQFLKYILTPTDRLRKLIEESESKFKFQHPIVGLHIRRTDKLKWEAHFHYLDEYMENVEEYFQLLQMKQPNIKRRVYLASDDETVFQEAKKRYPNYVFTGDPNNAKLAILNKRNSNESLVAIILDIYFLYRSDFLVCTLSSNVGRLAYSLMQTLDTDASSNVHSVDKEYFYYKASLNDLQAILPHRASNRSEIDLHAGDFIELSRRYFNGYYQGTNRCTNGYFEGSNRRTRKSGLFPLYKVRDVVCYADFGNYSYPTYS